MKIAVFHSLCYCQQPDRSQEAFVQMVAGSIVVVKFKINKVDQRRVRPVGRTLTGWPRGKTPGTGLRVLAKLLAIRRAGFTGNLVAVAGK